jgi:hypothetical protein
MIETMDADEERLRREKQKESELKDRETARKGGLCLVQNFNKRCRENMTYRSSLSDLSRSGHTSCQEAE